MLETQINKLHDQLIECMEKQTPVSIYHKGECYELQFFCVTLEDVIGLIAVSDGVNKCCIKTASVIRIKEPLETDEDMTYEIELKNHEIIYITMI